MLGILIKHWATIFFLAIIAALSVWVGILKLNVDREKMTILTIQTGLSKKRAIDVEKARQIENLHANETLTLSTSYANTITAIRKESDYETAHHSGVRCTFTRPARLRVHSTTKPTPNSTYLPTTPNPPTTVKGATPDPLASQYVSGPTTQQLMSLPRQCAETTAGYLALQKFVTEECGSK